MLRVSTFLAAAILALPAAAHSGDHGHMSLLQVIAHYAEPDHLAFLAMTVIVGVLAFRAGRRHEARRVMAERKALKP